MTPYFGTRIRMLAGTDACWPPCLLMRLRMPACIPACLQPNASAMLDPGLL